jgi:hypothetical protein
MADRRQIDTVYGTRRMESIIVSAVTETCQVVKYISVFFDKCREDCKRRQVRRHEHGGGNGGIEHA